MVHLLTELLFVLYLAFYFVFYFVICTLIELPFLIKVYILFYLIELLSFACFFPL